jgi:uncharacterized protein (DUF1499 family)
MRRLIIEEPYSMAAIWSRRFSIFAVAVAVIAVVLGRISSIEAAAVISVLAAAILFALIAILLAATAAVVIWRTGCQGVGFAIVGGLIAVSLLLYPGYLTVKAVTLPKINDISTDLADPPAFSRSSKAQAARGGSSAPPIDAAQRELQMHAYPGVQPVVLDLEPDEAFQLVLKAVEELHWRLIEKAQPGGRTGIGHVDAIDRTLIMGFPDDITIRIRPLASQTRVDVRSASRFGSHDFGTNARRIEKFIEELQTQLENR